MMEYPTAQRAFEAVIGDMLAAESIGGDETVQGRLHQPTREVLNYQFEIGSPLDRISSTIKLNVAVARFVWMMTANNRLADIAFYEPKVGSFTDDGLTVPGSSYGMRLRQPQPGLDQVAGAIARLKDDPNTRRAAVTIYQPWDAVRTSNDIPCAFGMMFHNRSGKLNTTILMRSNNSWALLPFNIFEFSMLAEVIAVEAGLQLGKISYFAGSMHVYERDAERADQYLSAKRTSINSMAPMPHDVSPLKELTELGKIEADLRHGSAAIDNRNVNEWIDRITKAVSPYWAQIGLLLLVSIAAKKDQRTLDQVVRRLESVYRPFVPSEATASPGPAQLDYGPLFGNTAGTERVTVITRTALGQKFAELAARHEVENGPIGAAKLLQAQNQIFERLAARGENDTLTPAAFEAVLKSIS